MVSLKRRINDINNQKTNSKLLWKRTGKRNSKDIFTAEKKKHMETIVIKINPYKIIAHIFFVDDFLGCWFTSM